MEHLLDARPCRREGVREAPDAPPAHVQGQGAVSTQKRAGAPTGISTGLGRGSKETGRVRWLREGREGTGGEGFSMESRGVPIQSRDSGEGRGGEARQCSIWKQRREWPGVGMQDPGGRDLTWLGHCQISPWS